MSDGASPRPKIFLLITDAGGGHRASALSLVEWARTAGKPWDFRTVNVYRDVLQRTEPIKRVLGFYGEDAYNFVLRHQLRKPVPLMHRIALATSRVPQRRARERSIRFLAAHQPDLCVSLMPFINDALASFAAAANVPFGVICTDLVDTRPAMWFTAGAMITSRFVCTGSPEALEQARGAGAGNRAVATGLVIHPKYFNGDARWLDPGDARRRLGLAPSSFTVAIVMGGYAGSATRDIVRQLEGCEGGWQVIACCGHNEALKRDLESLAPSLHNRLVPLGFTSDLPSVLRAAHVVVAKPGPATLMECVALGVPLVLDDVDTLPQERPNAAWAEQQGCALTVRDRSRTLEAVNRLRVDAELRNRIRRCQAGAVGEPAGPAMLQAIEDALSQSDHRRMPDAA